MSAQGTPVIPAAPAELSIRRQVLTVLERVFAAAAPQEGCALLLGLREPESWRLTTVWPCSNVWQPAEERCHRFSIDPREQLHAQKWARRRDLLVLGSAHSHPQGPPVPSATDRALAFAPALMLILGQGEGGQELGCWWLGEAAAGPPPSRPLAWRMVD
jgi:proteasome lid subunit RPN8/RPN11